METCRAHGSYLFSDEMYHLLTARPEDRLTSACDAYERGITLSGVAPLLGVASLCQVWHPCPKNDAGILSRARSIPLMVSSCGAPGLEAQTRSNHVVLG